MTRFSAPIAEQIWDLKYRFKDGDGNPIDENVEATWERIAHALAQAEGGPRGTRQRHRRDFYKALEDFKFLPAGRIIAGAGTERAVTLFNCFVMGTIPDSMSGIFEMLKEAALTMQQGGGIGYDFSTIRPSTSRVKKLGADASGPLSFMDCWDSMCRTVMSAGSRRGAMMATMRCDHPDIEKFITAKQDTAKLRMFNLSVLVTDEFMDAVAENFDWPLVHVEPPKVEGIPEELDSEDGVVRYVHKVVKARDLWNLIMQSTYDAAEPGVIFIDRINSLNNLKDVETISATNPCGEQPLPPYGACLLGSINLAKLILQPFTEHARVDKATLKKTVETAIRMMDNVIDVSNFPHEQQRMEAQNKRRIGLGVTGLADALIMLNVIYGSEEAVELTESILKEIALASYWASVKLAKEKGPFPLLDMMAWPPEGSHVEMLCNEDPELRKAMQKHGIRNALLTSIAPTGTISLYAGNVSSGIEPVFALSYTRKVLQPDGSRTEELVEDYAVTAYREHWESQWADDDIDRPEWSDDLLPETFVTAQTLSPLDHLVMQAAAQKWVDSSISKTINLPEDISFADFKHVYWEAYESGCKGCTTYRPNEITGSVLSVETKPAEAEEEEYPTTSQATGKQIDDVTPTLDELIEAAREVLMSESESTAQTKSFAAANLAIDKAEELPKRPDELRGSTYKIKIGDQSAVYLTVNDMIESNGTIRPFEIFLRSSDPNHDEWMVALARTISAVLRRPYDASFLADELKQVHSTITGGYGMGKFMPSLVAAIGTKLGDHMAGMKADNEIIRNMTFSGVGSREQAEFSFLVADDSADFPDFPDQTFVASKPKGKPCPKCGSYDFKHESGCETCMSCGWSKCG